MSYAKTGIVDQLLELNRGRLAIAERQIRESADVGGIHRIDHSCKRQIVLGNVAQKIDGCRRIVLPQLDRGPDGGNEVMLHERVLGPLGADLVCESAGFRCLSGSRKRQRQGNLAIAIQRASSCLAFIASSLHVLSDFAILQGRDEHPPVSIASLRGPSRSLQSQTLGGVKATLLNLDQGMFMQEVFPIVALLLVPEDLFDVVPVA